jgi:hypothetical protein
MSNPSFRPRNNRPIQDYIPDVKKDTGSNNYRDSFTAIARMLQQNYPEFEVSHALALSKTFNIPVNILVQLFEGFTRALVLDGKLQEIKGCYDTSVFCWI